MLTARIGAVMAWSMSPRMMALLLATPLPDAHGFFIVTAISLLLPSVATAQSRGGLLSLAA